MAPNIVTTLAWRLRMAKPPVIRQLVVPSHHHEGELVRSKMTRKLDEDRATEEVRRAVNVWLYSGET